MRAVATWRSDSTVWTLTAVVVLVFAAPLHAQTSLMPERREQTPNYIGWTPIGLHYPTAYSPPFSVAKHLDRRWMVGVDLGLRLSQAPVTTHEDIAPLNSRPTWWHRSCAEAELRDAQFFNPGTFVRYMANNTLFLGAALHHRTWSGKTSIDYNHGCAGGSGDATGRMETQAVVASAMLGNSWLRADGFTITGTWAIASTALSQSSNFSLTSGQGLTTADKRRLREKADELADGLNGRASASGVAVLSVGKSF